MVTPNQTESTVVNCDTSDGVLKDSRGPAHSFTILLTDDPDIVIIDGCVPRAKALRIFHELFEIRT